MPINSTGPYHVGPDAPETVPPVTILESPTGKPVVPPAATKWLAVVWALVCAGAQALPEGEAKGWAMFGLTVLGPLLGMSTVGLRRK